jgi:hypothetical protein
LRLTRPSIVAGGNSLRASLRRAIADRYTCKAGAADGLHRYRIRVTAVVLSDGA